MKAAIVTKYGSPEVMQITEVAKPTPKAGEVLVKVHAAAVTAGDARIRGAKFPPGFGLFARLAFGVTRPRKKILGGSFSGVVEALGEGVGLFKVGDEVFGMKGLKMGAHAEYLTVSETKAVALKPANVSHVDAAAMPFGGTTALYFLRDKLKLKPGQKILINGASGAVGTNAIQLAKLFGAHVTAVCSTNNVELVKTLGADEVIDYTQGSIGANGVKYDAVLETIGNLSVKEGLSLLNETGKLALIAAGLPQMLRFGKKIVTGTAFEKKEDIEYLARLMAEDKLKVVIDSIYPLEGIPEAYRRVDGGHKKGNVVVEV